jgi:hypothetical protein
LDVEGWVSRDAERHLNGCRLPDIATWRTKCVNPRMYKSAFLGSSSEEACISPHYSHDAMTP